jgi:hypothetical protein
MNGIENGPGQLGYSLPEAYRFGLFDSSFNEAARI